MPEKVDELKEELDRLVQQGLLLYISMLDAEEGLSEEDKKDLEEGKQELPNLKEEYEPWYSEALLVVKQIIPERLDDFVKLYKNEKRKEVSFLTYGISDYLIGLAVSRGVAPYDRVIVPTSSALPKMENQYRILQSAQKRFESSLFDIEAVLQADLFDSELEAASELSTKGFFRGAGAIAGVVLEAHLGHVCEQHSLKSRKKDPTISDFNDLLKKNDVIDTPKWRFIQHLGDLRNLCDHKKKREPTKEDISELVEGVDKVIKTVY